MVVVTCKPCKLRYKEGNMAPWIVVTICKLELVTYKLGCLEVSKAPWMVVATCK